MESLLEYAKALKTKTCPVCESPLVAEINQALVDKSVSQRTIVKWAQGKGASYITKARLATHNDEKHYTNQRTNPRTVSKDRKKRAISS